MSNFKAVEFTEDMIDSVYDNGGKTADRYTVNVTDVHGDHYTILCDSEGRFVSGITAGHWARIEDREIFFSSLPERTQKAVIRFCIE